VQEVWDKQFRLFLLAYTASTFVIVAAWNTDVVAGGDSYCSFNALFVGLPTKAGQKRLPDETLKSAAQHSSLPTPTSERSPLSTCAGDDHP
jgi:hypothetical protein